MEEIYASFEEDPAIYKKSSLRNILVHANEVIWHEKNGVL